MKALIRIARLFRKPSRKESDTMADKTTSTPEKVEPALVPAFWRGGGDGTFKGRGSQRFTLESLGIEKYADQFIRLPVVRSGH